MTLKNRNNYKTTDTFAIQGEFYPPEQYANRLSGKLHYDPYWGAKLNFVTKNQKIDSFVLYGVLEDGNICTLFGPFRTENGNRFMSNGLVILSGDLTCTHLLLGEHVNLSTKFTSVEFKPLNMEGFFTNQANSSAIKSSEKDFKEYKLDNFTLKVTFANNLKHISSLSANLFTDSEETEKQLSKLDEYLNSLSYKPEIWIRQGYESMISMEYVQVKALGEVVADAFKICDFFAISLLRPVIAEKITLNYLENDESKRIEVFPTAYIEESTLRVALSESPHNFAPVTLKNIDFGKVINNWFDLGFNTRTIVAQVQHKRELRSIDEVYGGIIVLTTHLEDIHNEDKKSNACIELKAYDYCLQEYGNQLLQQRLIDLIGSNKKKSLGGLIGNLRGEIAHVGTRPRPITDKLGIMELMEIEHILRVVVCAYLLFKSGVDKRFVDGYLNHHNP